MALQPCQAWLQEAFRKRDAYLEKKAEETRRQRQEAALHNIPVLKMGEFLAGHAWLATETKCDPVDWTDWDAIAQPSHPVVRQERMVFPLLRPASSKERQVVFGIVSCSPSDESGLSTWMTRSRLRIHLLVDSSSALFISPTPSPVPQPFFVMNSQELGLDEEDIMPLVGGVRLWVVLMATLKSASSLLCGTLVF